MKMHAKRSLLALLLWLAAAGPTHAEKFEQCFTAIRAEAIKRGISPALVDEALGDVKFDEKAVRFSRSQPEYVTPIWEYLTFLVDDVRIREGRTRLKEYATTLQQVRQTYGVDDHTLTALWGIESDYGQERGEFFLPHALANVACARKRGDLFRNELFSLLRLVSRGDLKLKELYGSWAGAFGQTQFIPSTYARVAVDFDGDGRRDLIESEADALASAGNYLKKAGWQPGLPWGFEVNVPKAYRGPQGRQNKSPLSEWKKRGLSRASGKELAGPGTFGLILPAGKEGPAFLVSRNFDALYSYNASVAYALAIGHLSDRLRGGGGLAKPWPTDDPGLTRAQRKQLQQLLADKGYYAGPVDGRIGPLSNAAIKRAEKTAGYPETGRPSRKIFDWLHRS